MARIYKRPDREEYYIDLTDARGIRHRLAGYASKPLTAELARRLEQLRDCRKAGMPPPDDARRWLESQAAAVVAKWADMGLVDPAAAATVLPLRGHLDAWIADLAARKRIPAHVTRSRANIEFFFDATGAVFWPDLTKEKIRAAIDARIAATDAAAGTSNGWLMSLRTFVRWCLETGRVASDPTLGIKRRSQRADRRYLRRPLSSEDLRRLIAAADRSVRVKHGMTGKERALLYLVAASTGWRWIELRRLKRRDFFLDEDPPMIAPPGWTQKSGRDDRLPLRADVAGRLRAYFAAKRGDPDAPAFPMPKWIAGAKLLRYDLLHTGDNPITAAMKKKRGETPLAPIPYIDERGRVADFHSLRHALATMIGRAGVPIKLAQTIMRHADPALTLGVYTHAEDRERAAALEALPSLLATTPATPVPASAGTLPGQGASGAKAAPTSRVPKRAMPNTIPPAPAYSVDGSNSGSGAISGAKRPGNHRIPPENPPENITNDDFVIVDETPCQSATYADFTLEDTPPEPGISTPAPSLW